MTSTISDLRTQLTPEQKNRLKWKGGALRFLLRPHQLPIYKALWDCINDPTPEHTSHVINCSRQFGKSFTELVVAVEYCIRHPKSTVIFVAPLKTQANEIVTGETYFKIFESCPDDLRPRLDGSVISFPSGSRIRLGGTDNRNYENLRGGAAHLLILDEAGFMAHLDTGVLPALQPMLNSTRGKTIYSSTPPATAEHPYTDIYRQHAERGHVSTFTIFDNSHLTENDHIKAYIETACRKQPDGTWALSTRFKREYGAEFVTEETLRIVPEWIGSQRRVEEVQWDGYYQHYHHYHSMDLGVGDLTAGLLATYDFQQAVLVVEDEWDMSGHEMRTDLLAERSKGMEAKTWPKKPYKRISDNNNPLLLNDLGQKYDMPWLPVVKKSEFNERTRESMVNQTRTFIQAGRLIVHPRCKMLIGCLDYGIWDKQTQPRNFGRSATLGHYDHLAALVYLVLSLDQTTNPIPQSYGMMGAVHNNNWGEQTNVLQRALLPRRNHR